MRPCPEKLIDKERDSESGLDHFGARYNSSIAHEGSILLVL